MADDPATDADDDRPVAPPRPLRVACVILVLEAGALLAVGGFVLFSTAFGTPESVGRGLLDGAMVLLAAVVLLLGARGLLLLRPAARTPVVVLQVLAVPVAYSLGIQAGKVAYGGPMLLAALATLYLLFTPPVRAVLERDRSG